MPSEEEYTEAAHFLNDAIEWSYEKKLEESRKVTKWALRWSSNPIISSSFGKDSVVLTFLVHEIDDSVPILFNDTGVGFTETKKYKDRLIEEYGLTVHETQPEMTFWEIVEEHGYPKQSRHSKTGDPREPACCKILKYRPTEKFIKENDVDLNFVGLLGDEGRYRRWAFILKGASAHYYMKSMDIWKCIPLIWWTKEDVWRYHDEMGIPRNPVYEKYDIERTGCIPCTGHIGWREQIQKINPALYRKIERDLRGSNLEDYGLDTNDGKQKVHHVTDRRANAC